VRAFEAADETIIAAVFRTKVPDEQRLSPEQLVADLKAAGKSARFVPTVPQIVETIADEARPGDLVVVMSNGGFDGIHARLLTVLRERAPEPDDAPAPSSTGEA
jgi:UDP-N-acetylmuramate: L-alanyl-gamma-D-glutamyl-meso-diaminopimelate ligase